MKLEHLTWPVRPFAERHLGPRTEEMREMLAHLGVGSLDELATSTVPRSILRDLPLDIPEGQAEHLALEQLRAMMEKNTVVRSMLGMGYADCVVPPVIQRNILENPGWYTQYTPYQAEIAQGRLEALVNFQTMIADLTGLPLANASLLDEATAAAEAMGMCRAIARGKRNRFLVADDCHPQTIAVIQTRAESLDVQLEVLPAAQMRFEGEDCFGVLLQYPTTDGRICDYSAVIEAAHNAGCLVVMAADLLALCLMQPPGALGADIAVGSAQRFGVPMGAGGPHAAFLATRAEHKRHMPGRIIGVSKDAHGDIGYRLALQTREQHIRRDRATSNICTAQVLLAIMAGMYGVYHGPQGLRRIAERVHLLTATLARGLQEMGLDVGAEPFFDTLRVRLGSQDADGVVAAALQRGINLRRYDNGDIGVAVDETTTVEVIADLIAAFRHPEWNHPTIESLVPDIDALLLPMRFRRSTPYLQHEVFNRYHAEHEMLRYLHRLETKDLSLNTSMIPLGSCTMKLNATSEMLPVTWPEVGRIHPFAPADQVTGYRALYDDLERWLQEATGFAAVSLQPNSGAQGEYTGLLVIRAYQRARGEDHRRVCLIPTSAHGTNPASAVMAGFRVVPVACDDHGNIDLDDLRAKAVKHQDALGALMVTYPSTHGVFEATIREVCDIVHQHGGQVYLDGANMNAQVGLCRPGDYGADVCHLNLHKTFCIPHGGGGPGMGPIAAAAHLAPHLPGHPFADRQASEAIGPVSAAPYGSPSILTISWMYIAMMGAQGLKMASEVAILNANYMAKRLQDHFPILYRGENGRVAHEFIVDMRPFKKSASIEVDDIAKRLMDFGFHAPTMSWPVPGTMMIEPTESESKAELDRFCDALIKIREEIRDIEEGRSHRQDNPLKNAPHTARAATASDWSHSYSREQAAYPMAELREHKYWPPVGRVDNAYGDRHLMCTCPDMSQFE